MGVEKKKNFNGPMKSQNVINSEMPLSYLEMGDGLNNHGTTITNYVFDLLILTCVLFTIDTHPASGTYT